MSGTKILAAIFGGALLVTPASASAAELAAADAARFDGSWYVILVCPTTADGAFQYTLQFSATAKGGVVHGQIGAQGQPGWLSLDGAIEPDGSAKFAAKGLTGDSDYTRVKAGTPYGYDVTARFEGSRGTGTRVSGRYCNLTFTKQ